jgi:hypothetical protein
MSRRRMCPDDPRHGTANGYENLNCRCQACREAIAELRRIYNLTIDPDDPRHGRHGTYASGCRCTACREAANAYQRQRRERQRSAGR